MSKQKLRVLIVEDNPDDADLLLRELRKVYEVEYLRVLTAEDMRAALAGPRWHIILSDYAMPSFDAMAALQVRRASGLDVPFILISGTIGEETAVETLKAGAQDFMVKGKMARLLPAIERELREANVRRERSEAMDEVRRSQRRLSGIFSQVAVGIVESDLGGKITHANARFADIVGRPEPELIGKSLTDFIHADDAGAALEIVGDIRRGGRSFVTEKRYVRADGSEVWVNETISVVTDADGIPELSVAVVQDITDRKRAEEELKVAVRVRDEFLSIASHELKTPISALQPQVARMARLVREGRLGTVPAEKLEWMLGVVNRQIDRMNVLIGNLLDVTRITAGRLPTVRQETDLRELATSVAGRLAESVQKSGSVLKVTADESVVGAWDPMGVDTVISNLLSNAAKFGEGQPVELTIEKVGERARITVRDHGIGIPAEEQNRIFLRFERAVPAEHYGGLGLGLWIARQIVESHGGTIAVQSSKNQGSTFVVELPLQGAVPAPSAPPTSMHSDARPGAH
jgi:PAS domain S-box-containing protein